jgi:hypothetical protein
MRLIAASAHLGRDIGQREELAPAVRPTRSVRIGPGLLPVL